MVCIFVLDAGSQTLLKSFSLTDKTKVVKLECDAQNLIRFTTRSFPLKNGDSTRVLLGDILRISDSAFVIAPQIDEIHMNYQTDSVHTIVKNKKIATYSVRLDWKNLESICYQPYRASSWEDVGYSCVVIGGLVSLLVAPLISIRYHEGGFNTARYITCASIGLGFVTIGIPLGVCNGEKKFFFIQPENRKPIKIWKVINR